MCGDPCTYVTPSCLVRAPISHAPQGIPRCDAEPQWMRRGSAMPLPPSPSLPASWPLGASTYVTHLVWSCCMAEVLPGSVSSVLVCGGGTLRAVYRGLCRANDGRWCALVGRLSPACAALWHCAVSKSGACGLLTLWPCAVVGCCSCGCILCSGGCTWGRVLQHAQGHV
jgi:hypothetical protein